MQYHSTDGEFSAQGGFEFLTSPPHERGFPTYVHQLPHVSARRRHLATKEEHLAPIIQGNYSSGTFALQERMPQFPMKALLATLSLVICATISPGFAAPGGGPFTASLGYPLPRRLYNNEKTPTLLIKSEHFFVHDFTGRKKEELRDSYKRRANPITYTSRDSGEMHILYSSGDFDLGMVAPIFSRRRVLGITSDDKNIYFCVWQTSGSVPLNEKPTIDIGRISVLAFQGVDGRFIQEVAVLPDMDVSKIEAQDNLDVGPLRLEENALVCFDQTFKFDQGKLIAPKALPPIHIGGFPQSAGGEKPESFSGFNGNTFGF